MTYKTLISLKELLPHLGDPNWAIFDCHFDFDHPEAARQAYLEAHIPGALYADLDKDLSSPVQPGKTGRHPLPDIDTFVNTLSRWGVDENVQVVAYDNRGSSLAGRLWWMLRWLGQEAAAVLDGSFSHWQAAGYPVEAGQESRPPRSFKPNPNPDLICSADQILAMRNNPGYLVVDSRAAHRYRGEPDPFDPVSGHIPGAVNAPYEDNFTGDGHFKSPEELRARFEAVLEETPAENAVFYCGSGVTAAHNILAVEHAGLGFARLYPGSWSEWITDPSRPVSTQTGR